MPSKLTNMMASGKPVVATALPGSQIANVLEGRGVVVNPDDLDALCRAIEYLLDNETVSREMGKNGRLYAEQYWNIDKIMNKVFLGK
jgi:colanic acid biosynthesis glycosyl transferase WcaI